MKLADVFCDHMMLQRDQPIIIFGEGRGCGAIRFCGETVGFEADGEFRVILPPQPCGGPHRLEVTLDGETRVVDDILMGDIYLAAGQSNMEMKLEETEQYQGQLEPRPDIRLFCEPHQVDERLRQWKETPRWITPDGKSELGFSAVGYWFARRLADSAGTPVGVINCSKGASRVDAWTEPQRLAAEPYRGMLREKHRDYAAYPFNADGLLYRTKLLPLSPFALAGVLWYQGESNRGLAEARHYTALFGCMVENWRQLWHRQLPFYTVQLMPFEEPEEQADWSGIRLGQLEAARRLEGVYMTTLFDTQEAQKIHPQQKRCVGEALAGAVLHERNGRPVEYCGPLAQWAEFEPEGVRVYFTHSEGMHFLTDEPEDVYLFDQQGEKYPASAVVGQDAIVFFHHGLQAPCKIGMGLANVPKHNLYNGAGYLASPFLFQEKQPQGKEG